jgi:hypothetical protein
VQAADHHALRESLRLPKNIFMHLETKQSMACERHCKYPLFQQAAFARKAMGVNWAEAGTVGIVRTSFQVPTFSSNRRSRGGQWM